MKFSNSADKIIVSPVEYMFTKLKYVSQVSTYKDHIKGQIVHLNVFLWLVSGRAT